MDDLKVLPGKPTPLGANLADGGVNFAVYSKNATSVSIEFFRTPDDTEPCSRIDFDPVLNRTGDIWHCFVPDAKAGDLYLYRVDGPFDVSRGLR